MLVAELMEVSLTKVSPAASLQEAGTLMRTGATDVLLVEEDGRLLATVSARDLAVRGCGDGLDPRTASVDRVMSREPLRCASDLGLAEARALMGEKGADALVVCDGVGHPVGLLTRVRLLDVLAGPPFAQSRGPAPEQVERVRGDAF
jgi:CBS domain-containing protein